MSDTTRPVCSTPEPIPPLTLDIRAGLAGLDALDRLGQPLLGLLRHLGATTEQIAAIETDLVAINVGYACFADALRATADQAGRLAAVAEHLETNMRASVAAHVPTHRKPPSIN